MGCSRWCGCAEGCREFHPSGRFLHIALPVTDEFELARLHRRWPGLERVTIAPSRLWLRAAPQTLSPRPTARTRAVPPLRRRSKPWPTAVSGGERHLLPFCPSPLVPRGYALPTPRRLPTAISLPEPREWDALLSSATHNNAAFNAAGRSISRPRKIRRCPRRHVAAHICDSTASSWVGRDDVPPARGERS